MLEAFVHDPLINWRLLNTTEPATEAALARESQDLTAAAAGGGGPTAVAAAAGAVAAGAAAVMAGAQQVHLQTADCVYVFLFCMLKQIL